MAKAPKPALLIDASIYIFQYYFSLPDNWYSDTDYPTAAVYGYTTFLLRLLQEEQPDRIAACFDESLGSCFRNNIYSDYKISRPPADDALKFQINGCREITELLQIPTLASNIYEADDLIGTLYKKFKRGAAPIAILTRDKDLGQLIQRDQDYLWDYAKDQKHYAMHIQEKFGVLPSQLQDYLALVGDSIDDIPGVPGLGPKTAAALLQHYPCIDSIFGALDDLHLLPVRGAKKLADKLREHAEQIDIARQLTKIVDDVTPVPAASTLKWRKNQIDCAELQCFCQRMGFSRLYTRMENVLGFV